MPDDRRARRFHVFDVEPVPELPEGGGLALPAATRTPASRILPIVSAKAKSYTFKEVYYSPVASETAVARLREAKIEG